MDDAAAGGHPLHAAGLEKTGVSLVVAVPHAAREHVGHGLEAAMRMIGKAGEVIGGIVRAELVEHEEGIDILELRRADHAVELDPGAIARGHAARQLGDRADRRNGLAVHGAMLLSVSRDRAARPR